MRRGRLERQRRREEAEERHAAYSALTDPQKLASLTRHGHGHCKQAKRLVSLIKKGSSK